MLYRLEQFGDEKGNALTRRTPEPPAIGRVEFIATGTGAIDTMYGPRQIQFNFEIPAETIEEAFAGIQDAFEAARLKCQNEVRTKEMQNSLGLNGQRGLALPQG
jgi:hypothetical protein